MANKTIAEHMRDVLLEEGYSSVGYGDIGFLDECASRCTHTNLNNMPTKARHIRVLNGLEKSPLFVKHLTDIENSTLSIYKKKGTCTARRFWLVEADE